MLLMVTIVLPTVTIVLLMASTTYSNIRVPQISLQQGLLEEQGLDFDAKKNWHHSSVQVEFHQKKPRIPRVRIGPGTT